MNDLSKIVDGGYCIGCGGCASAIGNAIPVTLDQFGKFQADLSDVGRLSDADITSALYACPFSNSGPNEDEIGKKLFAEECSHDDRLGYHKDLFVGHASEENFREVGASGGLITWILAEMLRDGHIDTVAHVKKVEHAEDGVLFRYGLSHSIDEVKAGAKSRYYPIEMSEILTRIKERPGRYAVVGLPCFIKSVRRLMDLDPILKERVVYCVGLVCGHLKSKAFADSFGWQVGIPPGELKEVDFRVKLDDRSAGDYGMYFRGAGKEITRPKRGLLGANWGHNFFRYSACDFCDDVFAETADVVIGDAWLPKYINDSKGNSILLVRNKAVGELIENGQKSGRLNLVRSSPEELAQSQSGGLRDRREGLAYRLYLQTKKGEWAPNKRVAPRKKGIPRQRARIYQSRMEIGAASHHLWKKAVGIGEFERFRTLINPLIRRNQRLYRPLASRVVRKLIQIANKITRRSL